MIKWHVSQGCKDFSISTNQCETLTNQRIKSHDHLNRCRKSFSKNSVSTYDKHVKAVGIEGTYINIIKALHENPHSLILIMKS